MSKLLFRMRNVPEDEATEVRELLESHGISYYETFAGNWGISMPALWLRDESRLQEAKQLLQEYQQQRAIRVRAELEQLRAAGEAPSLLDSFRAQPWRFALYTAAALFILFVSVSAFF